MAVPIPPPSGGPGAPQQGQPPKPTPAQAVSQAPDPNQSMYSAWTNAGGFTHAGGMTNPMMSYLFPQPTSTATQQVGQPASMPSPNDPQYASLLQKYGQQQSQLQAGQAGQQART